MSWHYIVPGWLQSPYMILPKCQWMFFLLFFLLAVFCCCLSRPASGSAFAPQNDALVVVSVANLHKSASGPRADCIRTCVRALHLLKRVLSLWLRLRTCVRTPRRAYPDPHPDPLLLQNGALVVASAANLRPDTAPGVSGPASGTAPKWSSRCGFGCEPVSGHRAGRIRTRIRTRFCPTMVLSLWFWLRTCVRTLRRAYPDPHPGIAFVGNGALVVASAANLRPDIAPGVSGPASGPAFADPCASGPASGRSPRLAFKNL